MKLIDAEVFEGKLESLIKWVNIELEEDRFSEGCKASLKDALSTLKNFTPTIDAVPVVNGHWIMKNDLFGTKYECSECGHCDSKSTAVRGHYCWFCGAKMDGKVEEDATD